MNKEEEMQSVHLSKLVKMPTKIYQTYGWHNNLQEIHFKRILLQSKLLVENNILKGLCQLESMRSEVMQITFNCQNSIVFNA